MSSDPYPCLAGLFLPPSASFLRSFFLLGRRRKRNKKGIRGKAHVSLGAENGSRGWEGDFTGSFDAGNKHYMRPRESWSPIVSGGFESLEVVSLFFFFCQLGRERNSFLRLFVRVESTQQANLLPPSLRSAGRIHYYGLLNRLTQIFNGWFSSADFRGCTETMFACSQLGERGETTKGFDSVLSHGTHNAYTHARAHAHARLRLDRTEVLNPFLRPPSNLWERSSEASRDPLNLGRSSDPLLGRPHPQVENLRDRRRKVLLTDAQSSTSVYTWGWGLGGRGDNLICSSRKKRGGRRDSTCIFMFHVTG